ncbi:ubiquitin carboxyl-terminal hydrolase 3 [Caerostris extrusa]|uniref:ubiquitinyl hydrolase 1 n=1 Tax=Caerostris extrusa TaxID=172846 RepID=A0AAV4W1L8_CAEEX|nr:ubiquitin carboxyl-terminal hydrolase 3 [Caerostris extrusa]
MNAVLQSLSNIQQFSCYFKELPSLECKKHKNGKKNNHIRKDCNGAEMLLAEELRKLLFHYDKVVKVLYLQNHFCCNLEDSNALFIGAKGKATIVTTIFGGLLQNEVTCLACGTESKKHDPFLDLSLDIPHDAIVKPVSNKSKEEEQPSIQLSDCLSSFTELEELAESELYLCHNCKCKQRSTKKILDSATKLDNYIDFPVQGLDMNKFILVNRHETRGTSNGSTLYDLAAVIVHHGSGAGSGHYTAYATHDGCWHHFNDSSVTVTDVNTVLAARLTFYSTFAES